MERNINLMELSQIKGIGKSTIFRIQEYLNQKQVNILEEKGNIDNYVNKIFLEDCFKILPKIPKSSIDLILTDTPYLFNKGGNGGGHTKIATSQMYSKESKVMSEMSNFTYLDLFKLLEYSRHILKKMNFYAFCNDSLLAYYLYWATINKYKYNVLIWEKPLSVLNRERYSTNVEYVVRIYEDGVSLNKLDTTINTNSYKYSKVKNYRVQNKIHPTKKPDMYIKDIIELSSNEGEIILDPFMGEGTTIINAKKLNRRYIGIDIDKKYYQHVKKSLNKIK